MTVRALSAVERLAWLRLSRSENVGPATFFDLLRHFGSADAALEAIPELARRGGRAKRIQICTEAAARVEEKRVAELGGRLIAAIEPDYPRALAAISDPPPVLTVVGHVHILAKPVVGVVGTRNASANGLRFAEMLARDIGQAGFVVASGLARGIDTAAHKGALASGTIAVMAGGIDVPYPAENAELFRRICETGAAVSEIPPGVQPQARHFPRRNRIVSGLSLGVVVVEAALRSGSLITARLALEQGREVFAVPGSPLDPRYRGTNELLRQGAVLTEGAADVIQALRGNLAEPTRGQKPPENIPATPPRPDEVAAARPEIIEKLGLSPVPVDELLRQCQVSPAVLSLVLLELELAGRLERHPGHRVSLTILPD